MAKHHVNGKGWQHVGDISICVKRDGEGEVTWDFFPETKDPVGLTVAFIELFCRVFPQQPNLLLHVTNACSSKEHMDEVLSQLSDDARLFLAHLIERNKEGQVLEP